MQKTKPSYTKFLHDLLKVEVDATEQRRLDGRMRFANFPSQPPLEQFDYDAQPTLDRRLIDELATSVHRGESERAVHRPARSCFTLLLLCCSLDKQSSFFAKDLDSQAFAAPVGHLDGATLAALDLMQHGLAGDAATLRGVIQRHEARWNVGHELASHPIGESDAPWSARGELLAGQQALAQSAADGRFGHLELGAACWMVIISLSGSGGGAPGIPARNRVLWTRALGVNGSPVPVRRPCGDLAVGVMGSQAPDQLDRVLVGAKALAAAADEAH